MKSELMENPCISIVVPVYNARAFLEECLASIRAQTYSNWECLCVDDGSSDDSPEIVTKLAAQDARFRLIRQKNGGPGAARNTGLKLARGEYFTFVDADDLLHPEMFEKLLVLVRMHNADLAICDYVRFEHDGEFLQYLQQKEPSSVDVDVYNAPFLAELVNWKKFRVHPWGKLYQREKHGSLVFPPLYGAEDAYASFDVYAESKCTVFLQMQLYGYRVVSDGLTSSVSKYRNYISGDAEVAVHCLAVLSKHGVRDVIIAQIMKCYVMRIFYYLNKMSTDARLSKSEKKNLMALVCQGVKNIRQCVSGKYRIVPLVHYIPYGAAWMRALWLLVLWQWLRGHVFSPCLRKRADARP